MEKAVRRKFTDEFKEGAVKLVTDQGDKISETARNRCPQSFKLQIFRDHPELRMGWRHYFYLDVRGVPVLGGCN